MISYQVLRKINLRLQEIMERELPFGGLNMLLMGDLMQIEQVHGSWIYEQPAENKVHLWRLFQGDLCDRVGLGNRLEMIFTH